MSAITLVDEERLARARAALAEKPDGVVEALADQAGVSPADVLAVLPAGSVIRLPAAEFEAVWSDLASWGDVLFIVHTSDIVLEVDGPLPQGSESHGWFNIHGDSPIGGHIRKANCSGIALVDRPFHGRRSCSVWFMNDQGRAMFKVFVPRDEARELREPQLKKFEALFEQKRS